jgi:hypothetical protein
MDQVLNDISPLAYEGGGLKVIVKDHWSVLLIFR